MLFLSHDKCIFHTLQCVKCHLKQSYWLCVTVFKQGIPILFEYTINKTTYNKTSHNFINNLSTVIMFGICKPYSGWIYNCGMNYTLQCRMWFRKDLVLYHRQMDRLALGSSPYGPDAPRPYRRALCASKSDISSGQPCPFTKAPDGVLHHNGIL